MKKVLFIYILIILSLFSFSCSKKGKSISMVAATSVDNQLAFQVYTKGNWRPEKGAEFVKLHSYLDEPLMLTKINVESCGGDFKEPVTFYINFDEKIASKTGGKNISYDFKNPYTVRSITLNFRKNKDLCIKSINLFDAEKKKINIITPEVADGTATADSTLSPVSSYNIMNLFDSRYEYAWASDRKAKGVNLNFKFSKSQKITKIKLWNGYQRSLVHCYENSRAKTIKLFVDNKFAETLHVKDVMGPQIITLKKPVTGKDIKFEITESYPGKTYKDLVISELRFFNGKNWFILNPLQRINMIASANRQAFKTANIGGILNKSLRGSIAGGESPESSQHGNWTVRLRSDGSFFMEGETVTESYEIGEGKTQKFYALGNYEVKSKTTDLLKLRVFGFMRVYSSSFMIETEKYMDMDCNGCGSDCNLSSGDKNKKESIFQDFLTLKNKGTYFQIQNVSSRKRLNFSKLRLNYE